MLLVFLNEDKSTTFVKTTLFSFSAVPQAPSNFDVNKKTENSVTLTWSRPKNDGGSKVTAYQVEMRRPNSDMWDLANDYPIKGTELTINNLQPGKGYEFRVKAKNAAGWGDYATLDQSVTLKPDNGKNIKKMIRLSCNENLTQLFFVFTSCSNITWIA